MASDKATSLKEFITQQSWHMKCYNSVVTAASDSQVFWTTTQVFSFSVIFNVFYLYSEGFSHAYTSETI